MPAVYVCLCVILICVYVPVFEGKTITQKPKNIRIYLFQTEIMMKNLKQISIKVFYLFTVLIVLVP